MNWDPLYESAAVSAYRTLHSDLAFQTVTATSSANWTPLTSLLNHNPNLRNSRAYGETPWEYECIVEQPEMPIVFWSKNARDIADNQNQQTEIEEEFMSLLEGLHE